MLTSPIALAAGLALFSFAALLPAQAAAAPAKTPGVLSFTVQDIAGKPVPLSHYKGHVLLIVNTAVAVRQHAPVCLAGEAVPDVQGPGPADPRLPGQ